MSPAAFSRAAPVLRIDVESQVPVYRQIVNQVRALLVAGAVRPGEKLPPVRQLAVELCVHHNTVAEAYRTLAGEGWLELRRGRGATVLTRPAPRVDPGSRGRFVRRLDELCAEASARGLPGRDIAGALRAAAEQVAGGSAAADEEVCP